MRWLISKPCTWKWAIVGKEWARQYSHNLIGCILSRSVIYSSLRLIITHYDYLLKLVFYMQTIISIFELKEKPNLLFNDNCSVLYWYLEVLYF